MLGLVKKYTAGRVGRKVGRVEERVIDWNGLPKVQLNTHVPVGTARWEASMRILQLLATKGYSTRLDLNLALYEEKCFERAVQERTRRALRDLEDVRYVLQERNILVRKVNVYIIRLTDVGKQFCARQGWEVVESEYERLARVHNGEEQGKHTLAVLLFAYHTRRCGFTAEVLPPPVLESYEADVLVRDGDMKAYVEVEMKPLGGKLRKWRTMESCTGLIAICTLTEKRCIAFEKLLRKWGFRYFRLTDLQTLAKCSHLPGDVDHERLFMVGEG
jgi:hypothetical protein